MTPKEKANLLVWHRKKPQWYADMAKREFAGREDSGAHISTNKHLKAAFTHWSDAFLGCHLQGLYVARAAQ